MPDMHQKVQHAEKLSPEDRKAILKTLGDALKNRSMESKRVKDKGKGNGRA